ncbi:hypothetical protein OEZ86_007801 [Tetradesmus obliquus]|uniref:B3/B4 tRNA-binding domain-containing protein n=1 Tax=Tetradesmus obliquus TaxID=3088 RepID=A0ABY8U5D4_TETOB|nr:hypothetical protein OEZ85_013009 [Tetradesmus obliquus]WIA36504.1 hypothetical protein OEZ86_007801 [Tetradesmus obliquus]
MWPEVQACVDNNKHELRVTGKTLEQRLEESSGKVPEQLPSFLTFAELSGCAQLTELPQSLGQVTQLHELLVTNNGLASLPDSICSLPLLRTLIVEGNALEVLPEGLFSLPKLHTLNVSRNKLTSVSESLIDAKELHVLNIGYNQLQALPRCLVKLPKLSTLVASHNPITQLPGGISKLTGLLDLAMAHCALTAVPQELASAPKLKSLLLEGNPFDDKKMPKVLKEGRLKNIITHIKKHGAPPSKESEAEAAAAMSKLALAAAAAAARSYRLLPVEKDSNFDVHVHPEVKGVRPHLVCAVLRGVNFAALPGLFENFIALQTSIHESPLCNKRAAAAIGTHDMDKLQLPLHYEALAPADISFVPLARDADAAAAAAGDSAEDAAAAAAAASRFKLGQAVTADQLPQYFAGDRSMLKYLSYIQDKPSKAAPLFAVLRDSAQAVLSVSPVINAEHCKVTPETQQVLLEVSSSESLEAAQKAALEFLEQYGKACSAAAAAAGVEQQLQVSPVRMLTLGTGHVRSIFPR